MRTSRRLLLAGLICGSLVVGGCSGTSDSPGGAVSTGASSSAASPSGSSATSSASAEALSSAAIVALIRTVEWPDDEASIEATFERLPDTLAGSGIVDRMPHPPGSGVVEDDGYLVSYGSAGGSVTSMYVDPGIGVASPAHGMASDLIYSGGPQACVDIDHAPMFDVLFAMDDRDQMLQEMERIMRIQPTRGELVWLVCTRTHTGEPATPAPEEDWTYLASWSQGGWGYTVSAPSAQLRREGLQALVSAVSQAAS